MIEDGKKQRAEALLTPQEAEWLAQMNAVYGNEEYTKEEVQQHVWLMEAADEALRRSFEENDADDD